jgi:8-oxo-dGTP diphosphatase
MIQIIDKLAYIKIVDRKILITRSRGIADVYYIPGGKREKDESDLQALTREVKEELDVQLLPETVQFVGTFESQAHGKAEGVKVRMTCYTADYDGEIKPTSEIEEVAWFTYADKERTAPVDKIIFDWLKARNQID